MNKNISSSRGFELNNRLSPENNVKVSEKYVKSVSMDYMWNVVAWVLEKMKKDNHSHTIISERNKAA